MTCAGWVCSFPKSGRTWVRFMLAHYFNSLYDLGLPIDLETMFRVVTNDKDDPPRGPQAYAFTDRPDVPRVLFSHQRPAEEMIRADRLVFLLRSPLDVLVSLHLHLTKHSKVLRGSLAEFLRGPRGVSDFAGHLNAWADVLVPGQVVTYEAMIVDTAAVFRGMLNGLGVVYRPDLAAAAIEASRFDAMQRAEQRSAVVGHEYPRDDVDARRVRRGKIGGYRDTMAPRDVRYVCDALAAALTPRAWSLLSEHALAEELVRGRSGWWARVFHRGGVPRGPESRT